MQAPPRHFLSLLLLCFAGVIAAPSAFAQPPAPELPPRIPPASEKAAREQITAWTRQSQDYYGPSLARVRVGVAPSAVTVYSRGVNRVLCAVTVLGTSAVPERTWVGTEYGIKRVEGGRIVRHYTRADGLAANRVGDATADARGVVAVVSTGDGSSPVQPTLCWWNAQTDNWRTLLRLPAWLSGAANRWRVLLTPSRVVLLPSALSAPTNYPTMFDVVFWERADLEAGRDTPRTLRWGDAVSVQLQHTNGANPAVLAAAVWKDNVLLGTELGLLWIPSKAFDVPLAPPQTPASDFLPAPPAPTEAPVLLSQTRASDLIAGETEL